MQPPATGIAVPDMVGAEIRVCKVVALVICGLLIAGCLAVLVLLLPAFTMGWASGLFLGMAPLVPLSLVLLFVVPARMSYEATQRQHLADALVLAGHPGVDVRRLQAGRPVPSPQRVELRLRRERDEAGRRWLLVDAYAYAPQSDHASAAQPPAD
jgi:hypothetical protein